MESLHIKNFKARYHLPSSRLLLRDQLDRLLDGVLDGTVELILEHMGFSARDEICIRQIHIPVRLAMSLPDQSVVMNWSRAIAGHIQQMIQHNDPHNVIRYSSRQHALIDFAIGVARGDYHRAWAWHQLGFIREARIGTDEAAAAALTSALKDEAEWIIPVLKTVAQTGKFYQLVNRIPPKGWIDLAMNALAAYGVALEPHAVVEAADPKAVSNDPALSAAAARIISHSAFTATVRQHARLFTASRISPRVVAAFAIIDSEPALLRRSYRETQSLVQHTALGLQAIAKAAAPAVSGRQTSSSPTDAADHGRTALKLPKGSDDGNQITKGKARPSYAGESNHRRLPHRLDRIDSSQSHRIETGSKPIDGQVDDDFKGLSPRAPDFSNWRESGSSGQGNMDSDVFGYPDLAVDHHSKHDIYEILEGQESVLPDTRRTGYTDFGGLLFLLPLIDQIGIVDEIVSKCVFNDRPLRWVLHRLAIHLIPADEHDAGILAFSGLRPGDEFPWMDQPGPSGEETELMVGWIERIIQALRVRLHWVETPDAKILHLVCYRRARIEADPGWFEAIFSLRHVSTDIRRAALDIDPGFLPWLGVVIKFNYE